MVNAIHIVVSTVAVFAVVISYMLEPVKTATKSTGVLKDERRKP